LAGRHAGGALPAPGPADRWGRGVAATIQSHAAGRKGRIGGAP
jgi:hypothetical protein